MTAAFTKIDYGGSEGFTVTSDGYVVGLKRLYVMTLVITPVFRMFIGLFNKLSSFNAVSRFGLAVRR